MADKVRTKRHQSNRKSKAYRSQSVQKPNGVIGPRVKEVGDNTKPPDEPSLIVRVSPA